MNETIEPVQAHAFELQADQSAGVLHLGRRRFQVVVAQFSWSGYTIVVSRSVARRLAAGRRGLLEYQGKQVPRSFDRVESPGKWET